MRAHPTAIVFSFKMQQQRRRRSGTCDLTRVQVSASQSLLNVLTMMRPDAVAFELTRIMMEYKKPLSDELTDLRSDWASLCTVVLSDSECSPEVHYYTVTVPSLLPPKSTAATDAGMS